MGLACMCLPDRGMIVKTDREEAGPMHVLCMPEPLHFICHCDPQGQEGGWRAGAAIHGTMAVVAAYQSMHWQPTFCLEACWWRQAGSEQYAGWQMPYSRNRFDARDACVFQMRAGAAKEQAMD